MKKDDGWREVAGYLAEVLPQIDEVLGESNVPLAERSTRALRLLMKHMIRIDGDHEDSLLRSVHGRLQFIVDEWYQNRYGGAFDAERPHYETLIVIHASPFLLRVPHIFSTPGDEEGTVWFGVPASVQEEEDPLSWILGGPDILSLSEHERSDLQAQATDAAASIRSIACDLQGFKPVAQPVEGDLSTSIMADLGGAARDLCGRDAGKLRKAGWEISQAVEKTLKLFVYRSGKTPKRTHDLKELAIHAEALGLSRIDRSLLSRIPSGHQATDMRYGGSYSLSDGLGAYFAALEIIRPTVFAVRDRTEYDVRNARFLIKHSPRFEFDTYAFSESIRPTED